MTTWRPSCKWRLEDLKPPLLFLGSTSRAPEIPQEESRQCKNSFSDLQTLSRVCGISLFPFEANSRVSESLESRVRKVWLTWDSSSVGFTDPITPNIQHPLESRREATESRAATFWLRQLHDGNSCGHTFIKASFITESNIFVREKINYLKYLKRSPWALLLQLLRRPRWVFVMHFMKGRS